jgi:hypothetical protein
MDRMGEMDGRVKGIYVYMLKPDTKFFFRDRKLALLWSKKFVSYLKQEIVDAR